MTPCCRVSNSPPPAVVCQHWETVTRRRLPLHHRVRFSLQASPFLLHMEKAMEPQQNDSITPAVATQTMSKNAQKRLLKQQRYEAKKAEKKAQMKVQKKKEMERKRREWGEKLASVGEEERVKLIEERKGLRKERMEKRTEEKGRKIERLQGARVNGQNVVIDLEFADLMGSNELRSLVQQIMYCYAINGRCPVPAHIWLTGSKGEMQNQLQQIPGYDKWLIEKEDSSYIEVFHDRKENLVYLTADSENYLDELDPNAIYVIGGLVDRNRWKGITMEKAKKQGIRTAKLPIGTYLKMSSSPVLTVNQVVEILLKFTETKDWKDSFFQVIPQRKRCESGSEDKKDEVGKNGILEEDDQKMVIRLEDEEEDGSDIETVDGEGSGIVEDTQKAKKLCLGSEF